MNSLPITAPIAALLWLAVPLVFSIAFFLWWRRLRHWSFALLSVAAALSATAQICAPLGCHISRFGKTLEESDGTRYILVLAQASVALHVVTGALLLIGGMGLLSAARDDFLLDKAKKQSMSTDAVKGQPL